MQLFIEDKDALQKHVDGLQEKIEELEKAYKKARLSKKAQWGLVGVLFTGTVRFHPFPNHKKKKHITCQSPVIPMHSTIGADTRRLQQPMQHGHHLRIQAGFSKNQT